MFHFQRDEQKAAVRLDGRRARRLRHLPGLMAEI